MIEEKMYKVEKKGSYGQMTSSARLSCQNEVESDRSVYLLLFSCITWLCQMFICSWSSTNDADVEFMRFYVQTELPPRLAKFEF